MYSVCVGGGDDGGGGICMHVQCVCRGGMMGGICMHVQCVCVGGG